MATPEYPHLRGMQIAVKQMVEDELNAQLDAKIAAKLGPAVKDHVHAALAEAFGMVHNGNGKTKKRKAADAGAKTELCSRGCGAPTHRGSCKKTQAESAEGGTD